MPLIHLTTFIAAPVKRVFDLSRSISLHKYSMQAYDEVAIGSIRKGLINLDEEVTWTAKHLFKVRKLKIRITALTPNQRFVEEQVEGDFKYMKHEHVFKLCDNGTIMIDLFNFDSPHGFIGNALNKFYLKNYLRNLLEERNAVLKKVSEGNNWNVFLND
jgi:ligand-binding SRPBCC domain-containing protein